MADLHNVVGAIMSGIGRGRAQADLATLEVAEAYKKNALLADFPVPRMTIDEIVIDLKVAVNGVDTAPPQTQPTSQTAHAASVKAATASARALIAHDKELADLMRKNPQAKRIIEDSLSAALEKTLTTELTKAAPAADASAAGALSVLVTASDLQSIPAEKITSVRFTLKEADRSWTQVDNGDGTATSKLITS